MELISNFDEVDNHFAHFRKLAAGSDEIVVVSPYLSPDLQRILAKLSLTQLQSFRLVTTLEPFSPSQLYMVAALASLRGFFATVRPDVAWAVELADDLHGKIYLFRQHSAPIAAMVTSANFTDNGLRRNHEWGICIREIKLLERLEASLARLQSFRLSETDITSLIERRDAFVATHPESTELEIGLNLAAGMRIGAHSQPDERPVWLKPSGTAESPIVEGSEFGDPEMDLHFSKVRPAGVGVGDLIVMYGVGARRVLSLFEVIGPAAHATTEEIKIDAWKERWPWYVPARNLTRRFGTAWWCHNLYLHELESEYLKANPNGAITARGGVTLGALNYGSDKVRLDQGFANFVIEKVRLLDGQGAGLGPRGEEAIASPIA